MSRVQAVQVADLPADLQLFFVALRQYLRNFDKDTPVGTWGKLASERFLVLDSFSTFIGLSVEQVEKKLRELEEERMIRNLQFIEGCAQFEDGISVRKQSDFRQRMKDAGYVNLSVWLTPQQAEIVKQWSRDCVRARREGKDGPTAGLEFEQRYPDLGAAGN